MWLRKSLEEILEMITVWAALESMAARLATEHATDAQIASLRKARRQCSPARASADLERIFRGEYQISPAHSGAFRLCQMLGDIADGLFIHHARRSSSGDGRLVDRRSRSVVDHMNIIEAIEERDGALASRPRPRTHHAPSRLHIRRTWVRMEALSKARISRTKGECRWLPALSTVEDTA